MRKSFLLVLFSLISLSAQTPADDAAEIEKLNKQIVVLFGQSKFQEALPLA